MKLCCDERCGLSIRNYVRDRDRDREITEADRPAKADVYDRAIQLVVDTLREQSPENWSAAYSAERSKEKNRFAIMLSCAAHADHHIGQIIYLSRELTGRTVWREAKM